MTRQTLSPQAQQVIEQYLAFPIHDDVSCPIPYFNNKRSRVRAGLRVMIGKGSVSEISEELDIICLKERIERKTLTAEQAKQLLITHGVGIDCSGFAYYILDAESRAQTQRTLKSSIRFPHTWNPLRRLIRQWRIVENINVETFASNKNSTVVALRDVVPGDYITILDAGYAQTIDHIIVIESVEGAEQLPTKLHLVHSFMWSTDGQTHHGVRRSMIEITDISKPLTQQIWIEQGETGKENETLKRATEAKRVEIRRIQTKK